MSQQDKQPFYGRKISKVGVNVTNATDNQLVLKEDYNTGTLTYYDATVPRILIGKLPDGSYGIVISKPGTDVTTLFS